MTNALELLKSAATTKSVGANNPIDIFYGKVNAQIELAKEAIDGKAINTRSTWFRKVGNAYEVRIGRNAFEIAGAKLFKAKDLEDVIGVLNAAKMVVSQDKKLQEVITKHSAERSERLKAGRAKTKAEK